MVLIGLQQGHLLACHLILRMIFKMQAPPCGGFVGILLSVPLAAIAKILIEEFVMPLVEEFAAETPDEPAKGTTG